MDAFGPALLRVLALLLFLAGAASFLLLAKGAFELRRLASENTHNDTLPLLKSRLTPSVTVILAPEDAGSDARALTRRLLGLHFGNHEVVVALNAPDNADLTLWRREFHLESSERPIAGAPAMAKVRGVFEARQPFRLVVLELEPGATPLALNAAVNAAQSPIIALIPGDCDFVPEALLHLVRPMLEDPQRTVAVCGVAPGEPGAGLLQKFAALDFLRSWLSRAAAFSGWNLLAPPSGSAVLVSRDALAKAGGFQAGVLELFLKLHAMGRASSEPYRIALVPAAGCNRRTPQTKAEIRRAGAEAARDAARCVTAAGAMPPMMRAGLIAIHFVRPIVEIVACALTIAGLIAGWVDWRLALLMLLATVGLGMLLSMAAVSLRELAEFRGSDPARLTKLFIAAILENLGFRQVRGITLLATRGR